MVLELGHTSWCPICFPPADWRSGPNRLWRTAKVVFETEVGLHMEVLVKVKVGMR